MKKWTDEFISRALDGLPMDKYRDRGKAELTDHLLTLAEELESGGYSSEEAQEKALTCMGDPEDLKQGFQDQWRQHAMQTRTLFSKLSRDALVCFGLRILLRAPLLFGPVLLENHIFHVAHLSPLYPIVWAIINFWPGIRLSLGETHRYYTLFPYHERRRLAAYTSLLSWGIEFLLFVCIFIGIVIANAYERFVLLNGGYPYGFDPDHVFATCVLAWTGQVPLLFMESRFYIVLYFLTALVVCVFTAFAYRPRRIPGGDIS